MAEKTIKKDELIKLLDIELTPEQIQKLKDLKLNFPDEKIESEKIDLSWDEAKIQFKTELDTLKTDTVRKRFKNHKTQSDIENLISDAVKVANEKNRKEFLLENRITNIINNFEEVDKKDAKFLIKARINDGQKIEDVIADVSKRFTKTNQSSKKLISDFGSEVKKVDGKIIDPIAAELQKEIDKYNK